MKIINSFKGNYAFLSNFQTINITVHDKIWKTSEHMYMACKSQNPLIQERIRCINTPGQAKAYARKITLRPDWNKVKLGIMKRILKLKFTLNTIMKDNLLATDNAELIEGNYWHDNYWGNCQCPKCINKTGLNNLGKLLIQTRSDLLINKGEH